MRKTVDIRLRVPPEFKAKIKKYADDMGLSVPMWVYSVVVAELKDQQVLDSYSPGMIKKFEIKKLRGSLQGLAEKQKNEK